jgi:hypothetical protein
MNARPMASAAGIAVWAMAAGLAAPAAAGGDGIVCDGVIGNSGEAGSALVRFAPKRCRGLGVACDRFGSLWDRGGAGRMNRYAPDGRLLGSYVIPDAAGESDKLTIVGDTLVLLIGRRLYRLSITAKRGARAEKLPVEAERISFGSRGGRIAAAARDGRLMWIDPASGKSEKLSVAPIDGLRDLELTADGVIHAAARDGRIVRIAGGKVVADASPKRLPGERMQHLAGAWFTHAWHGTIKRFGADMRPDPGVVLGGASGHFIGHLPQNSELLNGRGMARLSDRLYAVGGLEGVMHLLEWQPVERRMRIVRRIGAMSDVRGIGLDGAGRIWAVAGSWQWADGPDAPMRFGVNAPEGGGIGQAVMLPGDVMLAPGRLWGQPTFYRGRLDTELRADRLGGNCNLRAGFVGSAVYRAQGQLVLLVIDATGKGQLFRIGSDGAFAANAGESTVHTALPVTRITSLAMNGPDVLLAGADGKVIELARDERDWKETRRWGRWGPRPDDAFGNEIHLAADAGRLWVADTQRHRVLCFDPATRKPLAAFGTPDKPGTAVTALSAPRALAARARRAVVFDAANQRLMKLRLR